MTKNLKGIASKLVLGAMLVAAVGCNTSPTGLDNNGGTTPESPVLPKSEMLDFKYDFFTQETNKSAAGRDNYFNARIRVAIISVVTEFILTPPITAFALAIHTVPSPQSDGSYLWVYTWVDGDEEAQIRLRGLPVGNHVEWELRVTALSENPPIDNELWFEGETRRHGDSGFFRFHDFQRDGKPVVGRIDWDSNGGDEALIFTDLDENPNSTLSYTVQGAEHSIEYIDAAGPDDWFIKWNGADGTGSMMAPDYNGGQEACWDDDQEDVACDSPA